MRAVPARLIQKTQVLARDVDFENVVDRPAPIPDPGLLAPREDER